ncbi:MAG: hypothetical protein K6A94_00970 [Bacteroidales bacterium]|nr:hypothetical protein [Bacteroidales bacterium]
MNARKMKKALRLIEFPNIEEIEQSIVITKRHEDGSVDGKLKVPMFRIKAGSRHTKYAERWVRALNDPWIERLKEATEEKLQEEEI